MVADALVDTFVVAAEDDDVAEHRQVVGHLLRKLLSVGRGKDHFVVVAFSLEGADGPVDGFALHHHAGETSIGIVVDAPPFVGGIVAQVVQVYLCQTFFLGTGEYRLMDEALEHFWQDGDDIYSHDFYLMVFLLLAMTILCFF